MASIRRTLAPASTIVLTVVVVAACSTSTTPSTPPSAPPSGTAALAAYDRFWDVLLDAYEAPAAKDWSTDLAVVATGQALESAERDVANYASLPAHAIGRPTRAPQVAESQGTLVTIADCVDLGTSTIVFDRSGDPVDDLENRVQRYRFRAEVRSSDGVWRVDRTTPVLDQPC